MKLKINSLLQSLIIVAIITVFNFPAMATDVGGIIDTDTTWDLAGSPYTITGNTLVTSGSKLTINPGVQVRFNGFYYLRIEGNIQAKGVYGNEILFTSNLVPQQKGDWNTLTTYNSVGSELSWIIFEFGNGISISEGADNKINNSIIRESNYVILSSPNLLLNNNYIHDCGYVDILNHEPIYFLNNTLENLFGTGSRDRGIYIANFTHPTINYNNFLNITGYTIELAPQTEGVIDARYNYWGPMTTAEMDTEGPNANIEKIYDFYDDPTFGRVDYNNWLNAPNPDAYPDPTAIPNFHPLADCGDDQAVHDQVTLNGTGSSDPDGSIVSYDWSLQHRTNSANDRDASGDNPTVSNLAPGFYDVCLTVTDDDGAVDLGHQKY